MKALFSFWLLALSSLLGLEVHFEDQHSGSFYHFVDSLDLEQEHALLLIDAHSDASCARLSDRLRAQMRSVNKDREARAHEWRKLGRVQVFDWIEPLMPKPISRVMWVGGEGQLLTAREQVDRQKDERANGALGTRWSVFSSVEQALENLASEEKLVVSIDLDFYTGMEAVVAQEMLEKTWRNILAYENLEAVSFAISRPWLEDEEEAVFLCEQVLEIVLNTAGTSLRLEPFAPRAIDRSELARDLLKEGKRPPRFKFADVSEKTRGLLLRERERIRVCYRKEQWQVLLEAWERELGGWWLEVTNHSLDVDERYRVKKGQQPSIRLQNRHGLTPSSVKWFVRKSEDTSYNVQPSLKLGKSFSAQGAWMAWLDHEFARSEGTVVSWERWSQLLPQGFGSLSLWAEAELAGERRRTPPITVRVLAGEGFRAGLSEQFALPYIFGVGSLHQGEWTGPELGWGNDCANFLVWAWHRDGWNLPWCNPRQLRERLEFLGGFAKGVKVDEEMIARGVVIDLDSHVAALWQDRGKIGLLDGDDLAVHQLGGVPEILKVSKLVKGRRDVSVRIRPAREKGEEFQFVGDICLDGVEREPALECLQKVATEGLLVGNLECVLTEQKERQGRYRFSAHPEWATALAQAGLQVVSLANNHALDCGPEGLRESAEALRAAGIHVSGAGATLEEALAPVRIGQTSFFGVNLINGEEVAIREKNWGVLCLPKDEVKLAQAIQLEASQNREVIMLVHWGIEFRDGTSVKQRKWARWFVRQGVDLVVGAHPHVSQPGDYWCGSRIEFSLGNFIFPYKGKGRVLGYRSEIEKEAEF